MNFQNPCWARRLAVLCGFMLWKMPLGEPWVNASYDYLFRFGARAVTNRVTLILMDNEAYRLNFTRSAASRGTGDCTPNC